MHKQCRAARWTENGKPTSQPVCVVYGMLAGLTPQIRMHDQVCTLFSDTEPVARYRTGALTPPESNGALLAKGTCVPTC